MTKTVKVTVTIVVVMLLFVGTIVGGFFYWLSQNRDSLKESQTAGLAFGKQTDDKRCWEEAVRRQPQAQSYTDTLKNNSFLLACLAAAQNPPGFCDEVPKPGEFLVTSSWTVKRCGEPELKSLSSSDCQGLLHTLQTYCSEYYKR